MRSTSSDETFNRNPPTQGLGVLLPYAVRYRSMLVYLLLGLVASSLLQMVFPLVTQSIVDVGIANNDFMFVQLVLIGQFILTLARMSHEFIKTWILLHLGSRVNFHLLSDFVSKLVVLPLPFFEQRNLGDILQRTSDLNRVQAFLTSTGSTILLSSASALVFGIFLAFYSPLLFVVFLTGSSASVAWAILFLGKRKSLDHRRFKKLSENQNAVVQLIHGMQEIKLCGIEEEKKREWQELQGDIFRLSVRSLSLYQLQQGGVVVLNEGKNILLTLMVAHAVINGGMTIGMMLAVQYIIGQLAGPVDQLLGLVQLTQDARISLERVAEVHTHPGELSLHAVCPPCAMEGPIILEKVSYAYGRDTGSVLNRLTASIEAHKVTAIVGASGSGKTTLLKLLLRFYEPTEGMILVGSTRLSDIDGRAWRRHCGAVMQDGFIFAGTVAANIAPGDPAPDATRLRLAAEIACLESFIDTLPDTYRANVGPGGHGISQGQRQRLLIARVVYRNPDLILFDEATSALDAATETQVISNLLEFHAGKTVLLVAHRLSTVLKADQILVLDQGMLVESGTHEELLRRGGRYLALVQSQSRLETRKAG